MNLKNKKILIIGAGRSGIAVAEFVSVHGAFAWLCDTKSFEQLVAEGYGIETCLDRSRVELVVGRQPSEEEIRNSDLLVISPGVPPDIVACKIAEQHGIEIFSEIEFANLFYKGRIVAITGTNGKTTTTTLIGSLYRDAGREIFVGGNIGAAFIQFVDQSTENSVISLEISSFQLSMTKKLHPRTAVITNITPDHLDRHKTFDNYIDAKANVFLNMNGSDRVILNYDDPVVRALEPRIHCEIYRFTLTDAPACDAYLHGDTIMLHLDGAHVALIEKKELNLLGNHNAANVMAAALAARLDGITLESIQRTLREFLPVANRLEFVAKKNGVSYINDSKGTNPEASITALQAIHDPIILIMGGYDKNASFDDMFFYIKKKVEHVVVLGQTKEKILDAAKKCGYQEITTVSNYREAVAVCAEKAKTGDCVLLSPACASWDMFEDYEQRGELFRQLVRQLL